MAIESLSSETRALIGCEYMGAVRRAMRARGIDAWSCDLLPAEDGSPFHLQCDVLTVLDQGWDLAVFHPPCTFLSVSGLHWNKRRPGRAAETVKALAFVDALWNAPIERIALENPIGCINTKLPHMPKPQIIQPYQFKADASKATCLWLKNLPPIRPNGRVSGRWVLWDGKYVERWANQTDSGQNRLGPSEDRWAERSETYPGIAEAMAYHWAAVAEAVAA